MRKLAINGVVLAWYVATRNFILMKDHSVRMGPAGAGANREGAQDGRKDSGGIFTIL